MCQPQTCVCGCFTLTAVARRSDNESRKANMIEGDVLSAADVSWRLMACVCVCAGVRVSHPGPLLLFFVGALKQKPVVTPGCVGERWRCE